MTASRLDKARIRVTWGSTIFELAGSIGRRWCVGRRRSLIVTKHGKPVARVVPYESRGADLIDSLRHTLTVRGDMFTTGIRWDADAQS